MKELQKTAGQGMPGQRPGQEWCSSCLADSRLQQVNLENTMALRELEAQKGVWNTGLQDSPMLPCSRFFSNLITQMLRRVTISPELKKEQGL